MGDREGGIHLDLRGVVWVRGEEAQICRGARGIVGGKGNGGRMRWGTGAGGGISPGRGGRGWVDGGGVVVDES